MKTEKGTPDLVIVSSADGHADAHHVGTWSNDHGMHGSWVEAIKQQEAVVQTALDVDADYILLAGDLLDSGRPHAEIIAQIDRVYGRLTGTKTKVIYVDGNHDQRTIVGRYRTPIAVYLHDKPWMSHVSSDPEVVERDGFKFALMPWVKVAGTRQLERTNADMSAFIHNMMDDVGDSPSIFSGHLTLEECSFGTKNRGSEVLSPTTVLEATVPVSVLDEGPWALARLGHIHKRQQVSAKTGYVGSTYKVTFGERNESKGCDVIRYYGNEATMEFREFDVRQLIQVEAHKDGGENPLVAAESAKEGDIVRFVLDHEGEPPTLDKALALMDRRKVEVQIVRRPRPRSSALQRDASLAVDLDPMQAFEVYLSRQGIEGDEAKALTDDFKDLFIQ